MGHVFLSEGRRFCLRLQNIRFGEPLDQFNWNLVLMISA
jgi:hypothetical protein